MLRIRLSRTGAKKQPSFRIVVTDIEAKRDGRIVERIGHYNPRTDPIEYRIDEDRALYWLSVGAQPTDPVRRLLVKQGTIDRLSRLRKGEAREDLVAEYLGVDQEEMVEGTPSEEPSTTMEEPQAVTEAALLVDEEE
ncbi:MAG: 30S ribosomal protein S16 [Chloroflexota bacterium]